jgi:aminoglycoside phosphotransferase (APT) family kinase protein
VEKLQGHGMANLSPAGDVLRRRPPTQTLHWVTDVIGVGSRVVSVRPLPSSWLANHAITVADRHDTRQRLVLRRWARPGWDLDDPDYSAQREATILELLADAAVPAPRLVAADAEGAVCDTPALLLTRLPGHPPDPAPHDRRAFLAQLAGVLPAIHAVNSRARVLVSAYQTYVRLDRLTMPAWLPQTPIWQRAFELVAGPAPDTHRCFIHRDYHHGNTLWARGRLTGVVDWTQASWGPASVDLGHMRWNLAIDYDIEAADEFLTFHQALTTDAIEHHPYWDILTVIDLVGDLDPADPIPRSDLERLEAYVAAALARL